jgi:hypothetical protein
MKKKIVIKAGDHRRRTTKKAAIDLGSYSNGLKKQEDDDLYAVEDRRHGDFNVYVSHTNKDRGSVREGLYDTIMIDSVPTFEEAEIKYPGIYLAEGKQEPDQMSSSPPDWFDPYAAGERWDDDY